MVKTETPIPAWLAGRLTRDDLASIAAAVRQVEVTTNGEIVPMIVRRSVAVGHVFPITALGLIVLYLAFGGATALAPWRGHEMTVAWTALDIAVLALGAWGLSRLPWVERLLTSDADSDAQVLRRAEIEFFEAGLNKTQDATGILLFVSHAERRAVVLADRSISAKLPPDTWGEILGMMIHGLKSGSVAPGLVRAIAAAGDHVRPHFPSKADDRNELRDALIIKE